MLEIVEDYLYNRGENAIYFIVILLTLVVGVMDVKYIVALGIVLYISLNMKDIKEKITREEIDSDKFFYNDKIHGLMDELRGYRRFNITAFTKGTKYFSKFFKLIKNIERVDMIHARQSFENAEYYLKKAINAFQSMTISVKEKSYSEHLKFPDELRSVKIGRICKELYKECYYLLWNLSKKINERNKDEDHLDRYKTYFSYNTSITEAFDKYKEGTELY